MTEDQLDREALAWLADVGCQHLYGPDIAPDGPAPEPDHYREVVLARRLRRAVAALNPGVPQAARDDAVHPVLNLGTPVLIAAKRQLHRWLVTGVPVQYPVGAETRGDFVRLVDWLGPARNEWLAVNQFSVSGPQHTRRPDIVRFVNGLPLVLIELKNPADLNAGVWKAYHPIETYKAQIPDLFQYNEVLVISDGTDALLGSLSADAERFMDWRTIDGVTLDPLGKFNELQTLVRGVLAPSKLLDYLRCFVLFEDDGALVKKIAGYHRLHAVRAAIAQVMAASRPDGRPGQRGKGGVVRHTQGSGKSITMTCFAARVMQMPLMANPTIGVITDRNDLDGQLFGVFSLSQDLLREQPVQAGTRLKQRPSATVLTTGAGLPAPAQAEYAPPVGRCQVGCAQQLRDALPNAIFAAFTGTPVSGEDRDTRAVFGDYISVYDMQQAKEDGAAVAIHYDSRLAQLGLRADDLTAIDDEVDELAEDEEASRRERLKSRWAALERVVGAEPRSASVAADLVAHFEERAKAQTGKAMGAAMSRDICVHLYIEMIKLLVAWFMQPAAAYRRLSKAH